MSGQRPLAEFGEQITIAAPQDTVSTAMSNQVFTSSIADFRDSTKSNQGLGALSKLVPDVEIGGFESPAPDNDHGFWHSVKTLFTGRETESEKLSKTLEKQLTPAEQKELEKERQALKNYEVSCNFAGKPPDTPVLDKLNGMVVQKEHEIAKQIRHDMSPADQKELDKEFKEWADANKKYFEQHKYGGGFEPEPEPGPAIKLFYQKEAQAVEAL
ncbi:MAG TPA: hypothetical protein V6C72_10850 [Chroococcales cyanobacterium]